MQVFFKQNLAILAVPKTGTTAYEAALKGKADIVFRGRRKHMSAEAFDTHCAPFLKNAYELTPERIAVMRDPLDHMRSWYRYRRRDALHGSKKSTANMSFEAFVTDAITRPVPPHANVGTQWKFLSLKDGRLPLHHLFAYERQEVFLKFLEARFGRAFELPQVNVSPRAEAPLSPETEAAFRAARAKDFALYDRVIAAAGHLQLEYG